MANKKFSELDAASASLPLSTIVPVVEPSNIGIKATQSTVASVHSSVPYLLFAEATSNDWTALTIVGDFITDSIKFRDYTIIIKNISGSTVNITSIGISGLITALPIKKYEDGISSNKTITILNGGTFITRLIPPYGNNAGCWIDLVAPSETTTASNGLTRDVDDLKLGGSVAAPTNIVLDTGGTLGINSITNTKKFGLYTSANDTIGVVLDPTLISGGVKTQSYVNESGKLSLSKRLHTTISHVGGTDGIFQIVFNKFNNTMDGSGGALTTDDLGVYLVELQSYGLLLDSGNLKYGYTDSSYHVGYKSDSSKFAVTAGESFAIKVSALYFINDVSGYNSGTSVRFKVENSGRVGDITSMINVFSGGTGISASATRIAYLSN